MNTMGVLLTIDLASMVLSLLFYSIAMRQQFSPYFIGFFLGHAMASAVLFVFLVLYFV